VSNNNADSLAALKGLAADSVAVTAADIQGFLQRQPALAGRDFQVVLDAEALNAGASGGTVLFDLVGDDLPERVTGSYVLRYELGDARFFLQTSMRSQFEIMRALKAHGIPVPDAPWLDEEGVIAGGEPALVMRRVRAHAPNIQYLQSGLFATSTEAQRKTMMRNLFAVAAKLHAIPLEALALPMLDARGGAGEHFIDRELNWGLVELRGRFPDVESGERAALHTEMRTTLEAAAETLRAAAPRQRKPVLVHGDLTIANTMYREDRSVAALLDWELTFHGLPGMDVAYFRAAMSGIEAMGDTVVDMPDEEEVLGYYREAGGTLDDFDYCRAFAAWRVAVWGVIGMRRMPREFWPAQKKMWEVHGGGLAEALARL
jgi:aminoglycoside phosphotransferase (APT) family kinase protein